MPPSHRMKLKDADIQDLNDFFEESLNRAQKIDKQQKIHLRKKSATNFSFLWDGNWPHPPRLSAAGKSA